MAAIGEPANLARSAIEHQYTANRLLPAARQVRQSGPGLGRSQFESDAGPRSDCHHNSLKDLVQRLEARDIEHTGRALAAERGREWQPAIRGKHVAGTLVGSTQLSSGRFAMIDDGLGFSLVPWRPALEQRVGRVISGVVLPGGDVNWSFRRSRGLGL